MASRDRWRCQYCSTPLDKYNLTIDHIVPKSKGGKSDVENLLSACSRCNSIKGPLELEQFLEKCQARAQEHAEIASYYRKIADNLSDGPERKR